MLNALQSQQQLLRQEIKGDLSENAEYDAAKGCTRAFGSKISKLQTLISNARLLDESKIDTSKVLLLSKVEFVNLATQKVTSI